MQNGEILGNTAEAYAKRDVRSNGELDACDGATAYQGSDSVVNRSWSIRGKGVVFVVLPDIQSQFETRSRMSS